jgi:hypothetical protein
VLTAAVFSAGGQLENAMGAVVLAVGGLLAWLGVAFMYYSDSADKRLAYRVSVLDSITLVCVLAHFSFLAWTFGHLRTLQSAEAKYEQQATVYNAKAEKISADNTKIAEAAATVAREQTKAERLRNDSIYQTRKAAEAGAVIRAPRSAPDASVGPALATSQIELERPTRPDKSSAAFLAEWDAWIRIANLAELILAASTLIYIRVRSAKTNSPTTQAPIPRPSRRLETPIAVPAFETTHVSRQIDDTTPAKKTTQGVNQVGLRRLREVLKLVGFHSKTHFKVDVKPDAGYLWIRQFRSEYGEAQTVGSARARLHLLDSAARMEQEKFRAELEEWLRENGFQL